MVKVVGSVVVVGMVVGIFISEKEIGNYISLYKLVKKLEFSQGEENT